METIKVGPDVRLNRDTYCAWCTKPAVVLVYYADGKRPACAYHAKKFTPVPVTP